MSLKSAAIRVNFGQIFQQFGAKGPDSLTGSKNDNKNEKKMIILKARMMNKQKQS